MAGLVCNLARLVDAFAVALVGTVFASGTPPSAWSASVGASLVARYVAAFNSHDINALADVVAEKYIQHNGRTGQDLAGLQAAVTGYFQTFPDMHMQLDDLIADGDKVVALVTLTATHSRPVQLGPGAPVFQPTGKKLTWGDIEIWRIANGKFVEHWDQSDLLGLARQMRPD
jgi:predicted ester cyclase